MKRWSMWFGLTLVAGLVGLTGCASTPPATETVVLKERQGRFSVQVAAAWQDVEAVQGGFVWRRLATGWQLDLNSPLGATLARLTVTPEGARLQQPDVAERQAASASDLLADVLGASVPVDALQDWVDGRVQTDASVTDLKRDDLGRVMSFQQGPWQVQFARYGQTGPGRIDVKGNQRGRDIELRLVIEQPA